MSLVSTYRPAKIGQADIDILNYFAENPHLSAYQIFKPKENKKNKKKSSKTISYKNIHKRIKRLEQLGSIEFVNKNFDRGAKHYQITPHGLTSFLSQFRSEHPRYIKSNIKNIVIKSLLLEYFEEETIDSFTLLKDDNTIEISDYLSECCSLINNTCSNMWNKIDKYSIKDILPKDEVIQKYMIYLDERTVDYHILEEVERYKDRLSDRLSPIENKLSFEDKFDLNYNYYLMSKYGHNIGKIEEAKKDPTKIAEEPPFPFNYIYVELDYLDYLLHQKIRSLAISLVNMIGYRIELEEPKYKNEIEEYQREKENKPSEKDIIPNLEGKKPIDLILEHFGRDYSMRFIMEDKKFWELIKDVRKLFDLGYNQFIKFRQ